MECRCRFVRSIIRVARRASTLQRRHELRRRGAPAQRLEHESRVDVFTTPAPPRERRVLSTCGTEVFGEVTVLALLCRSWTTVHRTTAHKLFASGIISGKVLPPTPHLYVCLYVCLSLSVPTHDCMHVCFCMYTYAYIRMHMYVHVCIFMNTLGRIIASSNKRYQLVRLRGLRTRISVSGPRRSMFHETNTEINS